MAAMREAQPECSNQLSTPPSMGRFDVSSSAMGRFDVSSSAGLAGFFVTKSDYVSLCLTEGSDCAIDLHSDRLRASAVAHVLAQAVHVVLRIAECDRKHEFPLRVIFEREACETEIVENLAIKKIYDPPTIYGIAGQTIRMPSDHSVSLAALCVGHRDQPQSRGILIRHSTKFLNEYCSRIGEAANGMRVVLRLVHLLTTLMERHLLLPTRPTRAHTRATPGNPRRTPTLTEPDAPRTNREAVGGFFGSQGRWGAL